MLNFSVPGDKIQNLSCRIKNLKFPANSTSPCIFSPEEITSRPISSGISIQAQCHCPKVVIIPLLPRDKKFPLRRGNINFINSVL